ncbi:MAG: sensor histidine kinase [Planctomycetota bacterium]
MVGGDSGQTAEYELPVPDPENGPEQRPAEGGLPENILRRNVHWFCSLRWFVIAMLALFGLLSRVPGLLEGFGLSVVDPWPWACAATLAAANLVFLAHARTLDRPQARMKARTNLWSQIVLDLVVLTVVVHYLGSLETYAAFAYLFHIVLACIFFTTGQSLVVAALASALFVGCVALEEAGALPRAGVYANGGLRAQMAGVTGYVPLSTASVIGIWVVVWYLGSHLSSMVRRRDSELAATNRRLVELQREKMQHMLRTTHELKAPFAAIHANTQVLLRGACGELSEEQRGVVERIGVRCRRLAAAIQEMLQLANLRSPNEQEVRWETVDLSELLDSCVAKVRRMAEERKVQVHQQVDCGPVRGVEERLQMMFTNLISNAVSYSEEGGRVVVRCRSSQNGPVISVEDDGIGIEPEKLPHIFEEYYRTEKAVRHNDQSTGLGLAIVKQVARNHALPLRVKSEVGAGTEVSVTFPAFEPDQQSPDS